MFTTAQLNRPSSADQSIEYTRICDEPRFASSLPKDFAYGFASASYQIEGGYRQGGRGPSIWDEELKDKENGNEACDSYNQFEEDLKLLKQYGSNAYRFSISWSRIIPKGGKDDPVNEVGVSYYRMMLTRLKEEGIVPWVTIFHWDTPLELQRRYGGWVDAPSFYEDWQRYCHVLFDRLGDLCQNWITFNEPLIYVMMSDLFIDPQWDRKISPWKTGRVLLLAHSQAVDIYRRAYQKQQGGRIGITLNCDWVTPIDASKDAVAAAEKAVDCSLGWWADPIFNGHYNANVIDFAGANLPEFTPQEWKLIHNSSEFFGLNHYGTMYATGKDADLATADGYTALAGSIERVPEDLDGNPIGIRGQNGHPYIVPWGFRALLQHVNKNYVKDSGLGIVITENGFAIDGEAQLPLEKIVNDSQRTYYFETYLAELIKAVIEDGIKIDGYLAWSLMDNLEWNVGFVPRFGCTFVDRENNFKRIPKNSAKSLRNIFEYAVAK